MYSLVKLISVASLGLLPNKILITSYILSIIPYRLTNTHKLYK